MEINALGFNLHYLVIASVHEEDDEKIMHQTISGGKNSILIK